MAGYVRTCKFQWAKTDLDWRRALSIESSRGQSQCEIETHNPTTQEILNCPQELIASYFKVYYSSGYY